MDDALNTSTWGQVNTFMDIIGPRVNNSTARSTPAKSHTLMRTAVKKPEPQTVTREVSQADLMPDAQDARANLFTAASLTDRSPLISRFSPNSEYEEPSSLTHRAEPLEVRQYPSMDGDARPAEAAEEPPMHTEATAVALEPPSFNIFKDPLPGTFEYSRAPSSYKESKWAIAKRLSGWSVLGVALIGVVAAGLFINSNFSKLELYVASSKAGFSATLPSIKPSGYNLNGISTGSGAIEASFKSNTDNRSYTINEKKSNVSSTDLLANYVSNKAGLNYQTVNASGNTIYIYNGHDATWTNNGIWYVLQDNNSLSDRQIIDIASSM